MPTSYTSSLRLTNQPEGGNPSTWGIIADQNFENIDDAIAAQTCVNITGGASYTLTTNNGADDEARAAALYIHGIPSSANSLIIPAVQKPYIVRTAFTSIAGGITVRTNTGTGVNFLTGQSRILYCDGLSVFPVAEAASALDPSQNLADLTNTSAARKNLDFGFITSCSTYSSAFQVSNGKLELITPEAYPVGSIYFNADNATNPSILLGYGTWSAFGQGRVLVGIGAGTDINAVTSTFPISATGGEYYHTQTQSELYPHAHSTTFGRRKLASGADTGLLLPSGSGNDSPATVGGTSDSVGGGTSMPWMQPYITVYMWRRTA